jgi:hypothetical protein
MYSPAETPSALGLPNSRIAADQEHVRRPLRKQSHRHDAGNLIQRRLERNWVLDEQVVHIEDVIAVVGDSPRAEPAGRRWR